jgi:hypothetical protein
MVVETPEETLEAEEGALVEIVEVLMELRNRHAGIVGDPLDVDIGEAAGLDRSASQRVSDERPVALI